MKRKRGQPTKYQSHYCDMLIEHMKRGYSFESFAGKIGVDRDTLYAWCGKQKHFSDAKKVGKEASLFWWEAQGIEGLYSHAVKDGEGGYSNATLNTGVWAMNMRNRFGWRDKVEITADVRTSDVSSDKLSELVGWLKGLNEVK